MIKFCCQINEWDLYELAVEKDHVHVYLGAQTKWSPSGIMNKVKGGTPNKIRKLFPELDEVYWGSTFWADGYLVKSIGKMTDKVISMYVRRHTER
jgi:putative transposase